MCLSADWTGILVLSNSSYLGCSFFWSSSVWLIGRPPFLGYFGSLLHLVLGVCLGPCFSVLRLLLYCLLLLSLFRLASCLWTSLVVFLSLCCGALFSCCCSCLHSSSWQQRLRPCVGLCPLHHVVGVVHVPLAPALRYSVLGDPESP